jgi:CHAD domain-containing protein
MKAVAVDPAEPFGAAAERIVAQRTEELFAAADGVLDTTDTAAVHDMRVASRRLRAVLEIFAPCFPKPEHKALLKEVKALADALGERGDPDVQLAALDEFAAAGVDVEPLVARLRERQAAANTVLAEALAAAREADLHGRLRALAAS